MKGLNPMNALAPAEAPQLEEAAKEAADYPMERVRI
jgi:hypothetical protein